MDHPIYKDMKNFIVYIFGAINFGCDMWGDNIYNRKNINMS